MIRAILVGLPFALWAVGAAACTTPGDVNAIASEAAERLNAERRAAGLPSVAFEQELGRAALAHACDMSDNEFFDHRGSDGSTLTSRIRAAGYRNCYAAENIGWGYRSAERMMTGWMDSAPHRKNILSRDVTDFGIAITNGAKGPNWVLVLAKRC